MASKENLYNTGKNMGRLALAGTALFVAAQQVDRGSQSQSQSQGQGLEVGGQMLTEEEITQIRNYDNYLAKSAKVELTATITPTATPEATVVVELKVPQVVEKLPLPQMTAEGAQLIERYKTELPEILTKINADPGQIEDLTIYYPIYRAGQDRFGVPWELTWIIHQAESTVSRNPAAYDCKIHCGPMQRAVAFHPQEDVDRANVGMEYLGTLPVRHSIDAAEIVWASAAIAEWAGEQRDFQRAFLKYSVRGPAEERFQRFLRLEELLKN